MRGFGWGLVLVAALAGPALADDDDDDYREDRDDHSAARWHAWEGGIGMPVGVVPHGAFPGKADGISASAGYRAGRVYLFGEYELLVERGYIDEARPNARALLHRVSGNVRADVLYTRLEDVAPITMFVEASAGEQILAWRTATSEHRPDLGLAIGGQMLVPARHGYWGMNVRLQFLIASAPSSGPAFLLSSNGNPAEPPPRDVGVLFSLGLPFGR